MRLWGLRWGKAVDQTQGRKDGCKLLPLKLVIEKRDGLAGAVVL